MNPTRRQLDALGACLDAGSIKCAAPVFGVGYDRMRHILRDLYRSLGVENMAQAVERLDADRPGWHVRAA